MHLLSLDHCSMAVCCNSAEFADLSVNKQCSKRTSFVKKRNAILGYVDFLSASYILGGAA